MFTNLVSAFIPPVRRILFFLSFLSFFFFYGAWETLPGRGSVCGRWFPVLCQWNGWGALIRQTTQRAGTLITLGGAVWQQAWRRGHVLPRLHTYRTNFYNLAQFFFFLLRLFCSNMHIFSSPGFAADKGASVYLCLSFPPLMPVLLPLLSLFLVSD